MPKKHFYSRCHCGTMLDGMLGWSRINYIAYIDPESDLVIKVQAHHDDNTGMVHNHHDLYNSELDAKKSQNHAGFIVVSSSNFPRGEIADSMDIESQTR